MSFQLSNMGTLENNGGLRFLILVLYNISNNPRLLYKEFRFWCLLLVSVVLLKLLLKNPFVIVGETYRFHTFSYKDTIIFRKTTTFINSGRESLRFNVKYWFYLKFGNFWVVFTVYLNGWGQFVMVIHVKNRNIWTIVNNYHITKPVGTLGFAQVMFSFGITKIIRH